MAAFASCLGVNGKACVHQVVKHKRCPAGARRVARPEECGERGEVAHHLDELVKPGGAPPVAVVCLSHHLKDGEAEDEPVRSERLVHLVDVEAAAPVHVEGCERCAESAADSVTVGMCVSVWRRSPPRRLGSGEQGGEIPVVSKYYCCWEASGVAAGRTLGVV